jgi:hypothetical protein
MSARLVGGHGIWRTGSCAHPEPHIIPENPNQSKGLLQSLAIIQVLERTGFLPQNVTFRLLQRYKQRFGPVFAHLFRATR